MKQYNVTGMSCASCQAHVEKAVSKVPGVKSVSVSLLTNSMRVEGDAKEADIVKAVEDAGYGAKKRDFGGNAAKSGSGAAAKLAAEEEALKDLGMEKAPIYQGLDEILQSRSPLAGKIVEFLKETYPEQMPILLATHELEPLLDQRISEAKAMFNQLHPIYQKRENVAQLDTMERIRTENQIAAVIWEEINREILYRPLSF